MPERNRASLSAVQLLPYASLQGKNVTIAESITLAARLHSTYYADGASFETYDGGNWYDPYVNYARDKGLLSENYDVQLLPYASLQQLPLPE